MLHPAPGRLYDNEIVPTVAPDVHVELVDDRYEIRLDDVTPAAAAHQPAVPRTALRKRAWTRRRGSSCRRRWSPPAG